MHVNNSKVGVAVCVHVSMVCWFAGVTNVLVRKEKTRYQLQYNS